MKLRIDVDNKKYISSYLSILSVGILSCIENKVISIDDAMDILYFPGMIDMFKDCIPNLSEAIHLGTELEDVQSIIPHLINESINEIKNINFQSISFSQDSDRHVFYNLKP